MDLLSHHQFALRVNGGLWTLDNTAKAAQSKSIYFFLRRFWVFFSARENWEKKREWESRSERERFHARATLYVSLHSLPNVPFTHLFPLLWSFLSSNSKICTPNLIFVVPIFFFSAKFPGLKKLLITVYWVNIFNRVSNSNHLHLLRPKSCLYRQIKWPFSKSV